MNPCSMDNHSWDIGATYTSGSLSESWVADDIVLECDACTKIYDIDYDILPDMDTMHSLFKARPEAIVEWPD